MAKISLSGVMQVPASHSLASLTTTTVTLLDAADEAHGWVFIAPQSKTLRKVGFRTGTVTTGATVVVNLESIDTATGLPNGALATATQVIADANDNVWFTVTLSPDTALTAGTAYAITIANPSASAGNLNIVSTVSGNIDQFQGPPYIVQFLGAPPTTWAKSSAFAAFPFYIEYDDGTTDNVGNFPFTSAALTAFNNTSATRERAMYFRFPIPVSIIGCYLAGDLDGSNCDVILYDSDGTTALKTLSLDKDINRAGSGGSRYLRFATQQDLLANTFYRLSLKPTSASNISLLEITFPSTTIMGAVDFGTNAYLSTRDSGGTWTETTTIRPQFALLVSALDDGTGSGSIAANPLGGFII